MHDDKEQAQTTAGVCITKKCITKKWITKITYSVKKISEQGSEPKGTCLEAWYKRPNIFGLERSSHQGCE